MVRLGSLAVFFAASSLAASIGNPDANGLVAARDAGADGELAARALTPADKTRIQQLKDLNVEAEKKLELDVGEGGFANPEAGKAQIKTREKQIAQIEAKGAN